MSKTDAVRWASSRTSYLKVHPSDRILYRESLQISKHIRDTNQAWFHHSQTRRQASTLQTLEALVQSGELKPDRAQKRVAKRLTRLQEALVDYDNSILFKPPPESQPPQDLEPKDNDDKIDSQSNSESQPEPPPTPILQIPRGLYIYGKVGTGKTMLMDSFYENTILEGGSDRKRRFHFHDFLSKIHAQIHDLKQRDLKEKGRNFSVDVSQANNPIHRVGMEFASKVSLLCLDEFQVTDIADALILSQLFSVLFQKGTVVVATSNRPPQDLYEGGLNRSYFLPFIDLLERHCITHHIPSEEDYRRLVSNCSSFFLHPDSDQNVESLVTTLASELVTSVDNVETPSQSRSMELQVGFNRSINMSEVYGGVDTDDENRQPSMACFSFEELCDTEKGSMDYRAIARAFDIVVLKDIPTMDLEGHNRARRFITLIDELYEGKCALVCSTLAAKIPGDLFDVAKNTRQQHFHDEAKDENEEESEMVLGIDVAQEGGTPVGALASVRELSFAFERSSSRIFEMCSRAWWDRNLDV